MRFEIAEQCYVSYHKSQSLLKCVTLCTIHYIGYTIHYVLYTIHYIAYTLHYMLCNLYTIYVILFTIYHFLYNICFILYTNIIYFQANRFRAAKPATMLRANVNTKYRLPCFRYQDAPRKPCQKVRQLHRSQAGG